MVPVVLVGSEEIRFEGHSAQQSSIQVREKMGLCDRVPGNGSWVHSSSLTPPLNVSVLLKVLLKRA